MERLSGSIRAAWDEKFRVYGSRSLALSGCGEYATPDWADWFNNRRLLEPTGHVPPARLEAEYYRRHCGLASLPDLNPELSGEPGGDSPS